MDAIFHAPDFEELIDWLRHQPLLVHNEQQNFLMTHAGISPDWDLATAKQCAHEVENVLRHGDYHNLIENMYENRPDCWHDDLQGLDRLRYSINVFTRMRFCYWDHRLDFDCKLPPESRPRRAHALV